MCSKQIILVIGLAIGTLNAYCQTFNKYFFIDSIATSAYSMVEKDSFLFVLGVNADISITNGIKTYLAKFDLSGNLLSHVSLRPSQFVYYIAGNQNTLIITHDNGMAATGFALNNYGRDFVSFTKFDSAGNISFYKTYGSSIPQYRHLYAYKLLEYDSSYYLVGSIQLADYSVITILIKIDLSGNLQFFKLYNNLPLWNGPLGFCRLSNGHLLLSCYSQDDLTSVNYWQAVQNTCFVEVDTAGNLMNQNCTTDGNTLAYYTLAISGENYLSSGSYYYDRVQGNGVLQKEYLAKWDSSFNLIWDWKAGGLSDQNSFTDFEQDGMKIIIDCGQDVDVIIDTQSFAGILAKVDSSGSPIWYRRYRVSTAISPDYAWNYLYDVDLMQNGDIVAVGSWVSTTSNGPLYVPQVGWILRVNSNGCMDNGDCGISGIDDKPSPTSSMQFRPVQIFPNPSNGIFNVNAMAQLPAATCIDVYDALGKKLLSQPIFFHSNLINLYHLANGVYFYKITNGLFTVEEGELVIQK